MIVSDPKSDSSKFSSQFLRTGTGVQIYAFAILCSFKEEGKMIQTLWEIPGVIKARGRNFCGQRLKLRKLPTAPHFPK